MATAAAPTRRASPQGPAGGVRALARCAASRLRALPCHRALGGWRRTQGVSWTGSLGHPQSFRNPERVMARDKVINVQKKAQSLEQFQRRAAGEGSPALKAVVIGAGVLVLGIVAWGAWTVYRQHRAEAFETQIATLRLQVEGDGTTPVPADQLQSRMQAALPRLEALVQDAP